MFQPRTLARPLLLVRPTHPRLARGGPNCRVLTTSDMMAAIGELPTAEQTLAALTAAVDRAVALGVAA